MGYHLSLRWLSPHEMATEQQSLQAYPWDQSLQRPFIISNPLILCKHGTEAAWAMLSHTEFNLYCGLLPPKLDDIQNNIILIALHVKHQWWSKDQESEIKWVCSYIVKFICVWKYPPILCLLYFTYTSLGEMCLLDTALVPYDCYQATQKVKWGESMNIPIHIREGKENRDWGIEPIMDLNI